MKIKNLYFNKTCDFCPEQYDVFKINLKKRKIRKIGYVRLRHGYLYASYPNVMGKHVYDYTFDDERPCFYLDEERKYHLSKIADKLIKKDRFYKRWFYSLINFFNNKKENIS